MNYYNEIDKFAVAWLRELIKAGHIAPGDVDERDMWDVVPGELVGYSQWHFCAGIGTWSHSLRCAGWPDDRQVLTISLPCQPFSAAGKGGGLADERGQLAEAFFWIAGVLRPCTIIGEQVEAAIKHDWFDVVATHLEREGYSVGAVGFPACSVGAPHIRQRLYWVADSCFRSSKRDTGSVLTAQAQCSSQGKHNGDLPIGHSDGSPTGLVADAEHSERRAEHQEHGNAYGREGLGWNCNAGELGDTGEQRLQGHKPKLSQRGDRELLAQPGPVNGFWRDAEWIPCRDGKARPTEPGTFPLVDGTAAGMVPRCDKGAPADEIDPQNTGEARVMRLRGYGNAIVAPQAEAFIRAFMNL